MPDWLNDSFSNGVDLPLGTLAARFAAVFAFGCVVAGVYHFTHRPGKKAAPGFVATLVLLTILIAMVTLVIGNSVARAFSLVGALAIVRFRTVVQDTRDTAFVIFAVVVGMAAGAGYLAVPLVGMPVVAIAALMFRSGGLSTAGHSRDGTLEIRLAVGRDPEIALKDVFDKYFSKVHLFATGTALQGAAVELNYHVRFRDAGTVVGLVGDLTHLDGIQGVKYRQK